MHRINLLELCKFIVVSLKTKVKTKSVQPNSGNRKKLPRSQGFNILKAGEEM